MNCDSGRMVVANAGLCQNPRHHRCLVLKCRKRNAMISVVRLFVICHFVICLSVSSFARAADSIHILVWDERQPRQSEAYDNFLGNEIAKRLAATDSDFEVRSVALDDLQQGLSDENLNWADVIIWWGHVRQNQVTEANAEKVVQRIREGSLDLIALHSAHWARPFTYAMNYRSRKDAEKSVEKIVGDQNVEVSIETVKPPREFTVPIHGAVKTPALFGYKQGRNKWTAVLHLPYCCFPDYRPAGAPSSITVRKPGHPIAKGLEDGFRVPHTEMYNEPFHVPDPDDVIFEERWERGEYFRSGMVWNIGKGKVFYFRPGHETFEVFKEASTIKVLENACNWLGAD